MRASSSSAATTCSSSSGAGEGSAFPDDAYEAVGRADRLGRRRLGRRRAPAQGQGAGRRRVRPAARRARPLHLPPPRGRRGPDARARRERNLRRRVRDRRDEQPRAAAARADERDRGPARSTGRRLLPREAARRPRPAARRRARASRPARSSSSAAGWSATTRRVIALGLGANVTIVERSIDRMRHLEEVLGRAASRCSCRRASRSRSRSREADVVIGAVLIPGALAPKLVTREMVAGMKEGSVIADVAIDQGGCFETSRPTTHSEPVYVVDGVTHYCVANMPGAVPITATKALTNATLPYVEAIADHGPAPRRSRATRHLPAASTCSTARSPTKPSPKRTASTTRRSRTSYRCRRSDRLRALRAAASSSCPATGRA